MKYLLNDISLQIIEKQKASEIIKALMSYIDFTNQRNVSTSLRVYLSANEKQLFKYTESQVILFEKQCENILQGFIDNFILIPISDKDSVIQKAVDYLALYFEQANLPAFDKKAIINFIAEKGCINQYYLVSEFQYADTLHSNIVIWQKQKDNHSIVFALIPNSVQKIVGIYENQ